MSAFGESRFMLSIRAPIPHHALSAPLLPCPWLKSQFGAGEGFRNARVVVVRRPLRSCRCLTETPPAAYIIPPAMANRQTPPRRRTCLRSFGRSARHLHGSFCHPRHSHAVQAWRSSSGCARRQKSSSKARSPMAMRDRLFLPTSLALVFPMTTS